jgi:hypothetical protein
MLCSYDAAAGMISKWQRSKAIVSDLMALRRAEKLISLEHSNSSEISFPARFFPLFRKLSLYLRILTHAEGLLAHRHRR